MCDCRTDNPTFHIEDWGKKYPKKKTLNDAFEAYPYKDELVTNYLTETELNELATSLFNADIDGNSQIGDRISRIFNVIYDKADYDDEWAWKKGDE